MDRPMLFGKYCLLERISVGGMAEVFRAKPLPAEGMGKMLALKRILPHLAEDEEFITMFVDEAKLTVQLKHPNIVETYELGNFQSSYYILMEYIAGADVLTLQKRLRKRRRIMSVAQACYVAREVAKGLQYAHTKCDEDGRPLNIIHRDISPQNIRLTYDGRVKLIDFGIAKAAVQQTKTQVGVLKGKFGYMSPEQVHNEDIDHQSDIFALGTCLWEMLTNRRLFNGENEFETLQMVKQCNFPPPSEKNEQIPPEVDDIVMKALEPDTDKRYQSAQAFADALTGFLEGIDQPYTSRHLQQWMAETFSEELGEERRKREIYNQIHTPTDVKHFEELLPEDEELEDLIDDDDREEGEQVDEGVEVPEDEVDEPHTGEEEDDELWDPDFAPDEEDVDPEEFASNHTQVAAGGFDPSVFEDEEDDIMEIGDDDLIEVEEAEFDEAELDDSEVEPVGDGISQPGGARDEMGAASVEASSPGADRGQGAGAPAGSGDRQPRDDRTPSGRQSAASSPGGDASDEPARISAAGQASKQTAGNQLSSSSNDTPRAQVAQTDSGDTDPSARVESPSASNQRDAEGASSSSGRTWRLVAAAATVLVCLGLAATTGWYVTTQTASGETASTGTLVVNANPTPPSGAAFLVNGEKRGTTPPVYIPSLEADEFHRIEVRHPAYSKATREVKLQPGEIKSITMQMETDPSARARLQIDIEQAPDDVNVYIDGEDTPLEEVRNRLTLEQGRHLVEVAAPGYKLWARVLDVSPGDMLTEHVQLEPVGATLRVTAPEGSAVQVDGERVGTGTVRVDGLDPRKIHDIQVESPSGDETWESAIAYPRLANGVLEVDFDRLPESYEEEDFGWLTARTGDDWWELYVGGARTGLRTPVGDDDKIPVSSGDHKAMFRRGNQIERMDVEIEAGETYSVDENLSFQWNGELKQ